MKPIRFILFAFLLSIAYNGHAQSHAYLKTKALYYSGKTKKYRYYLRFYPDASVIGVSAYGKPSEVNNWFLKKNKTIQTGTYEIKGDSLFFDLESKTGIVKYRGLMSKKGLTIHSHSMINGFQTTRNYKRLKQ